MSSAASVKVAQYGIDNKYVKEEPSMTFFKSVIKKHTNYSTQSMTVNFDSPPKMGAINTITLPRNGDLIRRVHLKVYYPEVINNAPSYVYKWCSCVGQALVEYAELYIGGEKIQKITDIESYIASEYRTPDSHYAGLQLLENRYPIDDNQTQQLVSFPSSGTFYTPLYFYFNWHDASAIPLCALKYQEVKIKLKFRNVNQLVQTYFPFFMSRGSNRSHNIDNVATEALMKFTPCVEYVFLDKMEQDRFTSGKQLDYIIEQTQQTTFGDDDNKDPALFLPFTGMVKELTVIERNIDAVNGDTSNGNNYFNLYRGQGASHNYANAWYKDVTLSFNGNIVVPTIDGLWKPYYKYLLPLKHHTRVSNFNIYSWPFAEKPESLDPTGAANFSRIRSILMKAGSPHVGRKNICVTKLNIYRICDGIGATLFKE